MHPATARHSNPHLVLVIMGVFGCGKSTVAGMLATSLEWDVAEGDDLHPASNIDKMRAGIPLSDTDRWPWLANVAAWIAERVESDRPGIITCSALKRVYRDRLRAPNVVFIHLADSGGMIEQRLSDRRGHFMPAALLNSQTVALEPPGRDEYAIEVDAGPPADHVAAHILNRLKLSPQNPVVSS
ncbi:gluconokinase [Rhodococcus opacus]|jgi:gluconokinase